MKKFGLLAAVTLSVSLSASAASWDWRSCGDFMTPDAGTIYADATNPLFGELGAAAIYLIDAGVTSQSALLTGIRSAESASTYWSSLTKADSTTLNNDSQIDIKNLASYGKAGDTYNFYYAIFNSAADKILLTDSVSGLAREVSTTDLIFTDMSESTKLAFGDAAYSSTGWYSVPEPSSGLLLLLGMAGLALRRKQKKA